jgi:membrane fusion protein (multidrug efflux system)
MSKAQRYFFFALFFFLLCGGAVFFYWWIWGQYQETTDDAYVNGNMIMISPLEEGVIEAIFVDNAQIVEAGQPLVQLDPHYFQVKLEKTKAELADQVRSVVQGFIKVEELQAKKAVVASRLIQSQLDYEHRLALVADASVSREDFEHSETALVAMQANLQEVEKELEGAMAFVQNTTISTHPLVEKAKAALRDAFLSLHRCVVIAPVRGMIGQRKAQLGQWVRASDPLMALVPLDQIWVDANFREVSLKNLRIGQPVEIYSDMYGREIKYHGRVVGLNPGTGSVFSVLPPQNATGNWIKVVQRIPVKVSLPLEEISSHPLVLGLSMTVEVDTHNRSGLRLPQATAVRPLYTTSVYDEELSGAEKLIAQILKENIPQERVSLQPDLEGLSP